MSSQNSAEEDKKEEKSFLKVVVHSFFIIPFLIAVFCVLLFTAMNLLTQEKRNAFDYLEDVKTGGLTKRWQGAFELSKILSNPKLLPDDDRFSNELISAFEHAKHDDNRIRQYLALAMGRTGKAKFAQTLLDGLKDEKEENISALIYSLGMLRVKDTAPALYEYIDHPNARIRSVTIVALGNIANPDSKSLIQKGLTDQEPNVQWGAAISLANMGDATGKNILLKLLDRNYLSKFQEVDQNEQNNLLLAALEASSLLKDQELRLKIKDLSETDRNMNVRAKAQKILQ